MKSFLLRPNHLFRTIHPKHFLNLLSQFEDVKKKVIASLLDLPVATLSDSIYAVMNFPVADGGLGMYLFEDISKAAYLASGIAFDRSMLMLQITDSR